jgi:hypothetical protein
MPLSTGYISLQIQDLRFWIGGIAPGPGSILGVAG